MLTKERMSQIKKLVFAWEEDERLKEDHVTLDHVFSGITHILFSLTEPFSVTPVGGHQLRSEYAERLQRASDKMGVSIEELKEWYTQMAVREGWYPRIGESLEQLEVRRGEV